MEIIHCDDEVLSNIPKIIGLLEGIYGEDVVEIPLFAVLDGDKLGFISNVDGKCVFINHNGEYTLFTLSENDDLETIYKEPYTINFDDGPFLVDSNRVEHILDFNQRPYPDDEGFDGVISYKQYDIDKDVMCEITYQQMFREGPNGIAPIYPYHTKEIDSLFIDLDYVKRGSGLLKKGPLPKKSIYYGKVCFEAEDTGYRMMAIADYGLSEFLSKGAYNLLREQRAVRYAKMTRVKLNGEFGDNWPFGGQIKAQDLENIIREHGFNTSIPSELMRIYNGQDTIIQDIEKLVAEMVRVKKIYLEDNNTDLCVRLKLVPDGE